MGTKKIHQKKSIKKIYQQFLRTSVALLIKEKCKTKAGYTA